MGTCGPRALLRVHQLRDNTSCRPCAHRHACIGPLPPPRYKARSFGYLWAQGGSQQALEEALGVGGFGYPALVAYGPKDAKLSTMRRCGGRGQGAGAGGAQAGAGRGAPLSG